MEEDDLDLNAEDFDSLEKNALRQLSQSRSPVSFSSSASYSLSPQTTQLQKPLISDKNARSSKAEDINGKPGASSGDGSSRELPKSSIKFFLHSGGNVGAKFQYDQEIVNSVRKIPKVTWNAKERIWMFPVSSLTSAEKILAELCGPNLEVVSLDPLVHCAIAAASALSDLQEKYSTMPISIESKLLPFQRDGVRFALQHGARVLIADEMGLGKTLQAIAVAACIRESWPVLVLTPSSLRLQWAMMIQQWLDIPSSDIVVLLSQCGGSNRGGFRVVFSNTRGSIRLDGLFNIISYDVVPELQNVLPSSNFKLVIADESHFLKNEKAKWTTHSLPVIQKAKYAILLSGTPALSRPIELYKQLEALYPDVYRNVHDYGQRYCKGGIFGVYQGVSNYEELHSLMKATVMVRRLKKDVLSQLPVKRRQQVFLELANKDMRKIITLFNELKALKEKIKACTSKEEADSLKFTQKNLINKIYTGSAEAKIPAVLDYLETVIEAGCKFLIFAHHQPMVEAIHDFLLKKKVGCIRIDGGTSPVDRQSLVTDFQEKDAIKAAVLSIRAGGVGLTFTAASSVIFAELSWTPGDLIQAEDRAHRIGQVSSVNIYYLLANDTVDDIIWDVVQSKLDNLEIPDVAGDVSEKVADTEPVEEVIKGEKDVVEDKKEEEGQETLTPATAEETIPQEVIEDKAVIEVAEEEKPEEAKPTDENTVSAPVIADQAVKNLDEIPAPVEASDVTVTPTTVVESKMESEDTTAVAEAEVTPPAEEEKLSNNSGNIISKVKRSFSKVKKAFTGNSLWSKTNNSFSKVLDGRENALEVSSSQINIPSPAKQKTLDSLLKRCSGEDDTEHGQKLKIPRR